MGVTDFFDRSWKVLEISKFMQKLTATKKNGHRKSLEALGILLESRKSYGKFLLKIIFVSLAV